MDIKRMMGGALQGAPLQQQQGGPRRPFDEQIPGGMDPMGGMQQQGKKGMGFGDILSNFVINYGAASGNGFANNIIQQRLAEQQAEARQRAQEQLYNRKRTDDREDKQWEWENKPKEPNALERNVEWMQQATPEQRQAMEQYYDIVTPKLIQGADGRPMPVRRSSGPQIGAVIDGHRYKGGDPNSQTSWEAVGGSGGNTAGNFQQ